MFSFRIESQYPIEKVPFPAITLCVDTDPDEFQVMSLALNQVSFVFVIGHFTFTVKLLNTHILQLRFRCSGGEDSLLTPLESCSLPENKAVRESPHLATFLEDLEGMIDKATSTISKSLLTPVQMG